MLAKLAAAVPEQRVTCRVVDRDLLSWEAQESE
jgi:hypothetical protein